MCLTVAVFRPTNNMSDSLLIGTLDSDIEQPVNSSSDEEEEEEMNEIEFEGDAVKDFLKGL